MQYRKLGKQDFLVSILGYGCMRLPTVEGDSNSSNILEKETFQIIHHAIDSGINYIDTAYRYHSGQSEAVIGKALKNGYRDKVKLATKSPLTLVKTPADYDRILDEQLKKLDVDNIDFYLFHGLNRESWNTVLRLEIIPRAEAAQKAGKIGHLCFSFHDSYEVFEEIINGYDKWAFCQIQYSFMDEKNQAGTKGLKLAASKGIGVVVMEPLRGGKLANPIKEVVALMKEYGHTGTLADMALRWVWSQPEVSLALSGMTNMIHLEENLISVEKSALEPLSKNELMLIEDIQSIYAQRTGITCTNCSYCMPCPQSIPIPRMLDLYNETVIYDYIDEPKRSYAYNSNIAGKCNQCKECEKKCPQEIPISKWMKKIHKTLSEK